MAHVLSEHEESSDESEFTLCRRLTANPKEVSTMSLAEYLLDTTIPSTAMPPASMPMPNGAPVETHQPDGVADATDSSAGSEANEPIASCISSSGSEFGRGAIPAAALASKPAFGFTIAAADLASLNRLTRLKANQAPELHLAVLPGNLCCTTTTVDGRLTVAAAVKLQDTDPDRQFQIHMDSKVFARIAAVFQGVIEFTFDAESATLRWCTKGSTGKFSTTTKAAPPLTPGTDTNIVATLPAATINDAVKHATLFATELKRSRISYDGVRIGEGTVTSGYARALSRFISPAIPHEPAIILPVVHAANVKTLLAKLSGPIEIAEGETVIQLRATDATITWAKEGQWPAAMDKAFQLPVTWSFTLPTHELQKAVMALSIAMEQVEIKVEQQMASDPTMDHDRDQHLGRLVLAGHGPNAKGITPLSPWCRLDELPTTGWTFVLEVADLLTSAFAVKTDQVVLEVTDRGIYLRSDAPNYTTNTFLIGSQLS